MPNKTIKKISALFSGLFAVYLLPVAPAMAHANKDPSITPSADWERKAETLISASLENPGALFFTPQVPTQASFALGKKTWTGWTANINVQRNDLQNAPTVTYACALSTVKDVPQKKLFANYLIPASKNDFYTLASQDWLQKQAFIKLCGIDGEKCMINKDSAHLKAQNIAANPNTLVKGKAMGEPATWIACMAGTLRH